MMCSFDSLVPIIDFMIWLEEEQKTSKMKSSLQFLKIKMDKH